MGRYVLLLIAPVIIGFAIAATVVVLNSLRARRLDRRALLQATRPEQAVHPADPASREESDLPRRRIAS
jgi:hypothetical protein